MHTEVHGKERVAGGRRVRFHLFSERAALPARQVGLFRPSARRHPQVVSGELHRRRLKEHEAEAKLWVADEKLIQKVQDSAVQHPKARHHGLS